MNKEDIKNYTELNRMKAEYLNQLNDSVNLNPRSAHYKDYLHEQWNKKRVETIYQEEIKKLENGRSKN